MVKFKKKTIIELYEREKEYLVQQKVGSEEYKNSLERIMKLEKLLSDMKDQKGRTFIEGVKVAGGIILPMIGLIWITATEKEYTFTGVLREYTKYFFPKKLN